MDKTSDLPVQGATQIGIGTLDPVARQLIRAVMHMSHAEWHERSVAGCTNSEIRVLMCLRHQATPEAHDLTVSQISKQLRVTSPAITQLLKGLEGRGLVKRLNDATDKRTVPFRLTEPGIAVTNRAICTFTQSIHGLMAYLGAEESEHLAALLTKMFYYFSERSAIVNDSNWNGETES